MLKIFACKDGYLYKLNSDTIKYGVFNKLCGEFLGIRERFGREFIFGESHVDNPPGTARPIRELCICPYTTQAVADAEFSEEGDIFLWLKQTGESYDRAEHVGRSNRG